MIFALILFHAIGQIATLTLEKTTLVERVTTLESQAVLAASTSQAHRDENVRLKQSAQEQAKEVEQLKTELANKCCSIS